MPFKRTIINVLCCYQSSFSVHSSVLYAISVKLIKLIPLSNNYGIIMLHCSNISNPVVSGMKNQRCNWPRGKVIGGSSVLNYMLYVRGNKKDYDIWESLGNPGWGSEEALYYFKKSEDNRNPYLARTPYHSTGGYLTVQEAPWHTPLAAAFVQAGVEMG